MMRIVVKGVPPSLNRFAGRENSNEYRHEKKVWTDAVSWYARASKDRPSKPYRQAHVEIMYYFPTRVRHDPDNYAGKFILDGLTRAGVIVDDDLDHIHLHIAGRVDRLNPRTVITVKEVEDGC